MKKLKVIRDIIYRIRYKTLKDPINKGHKIYLTFNYLKWNLFYKYFNIKYVIKLQNEAISYVYPYPDHDAGEANIFTLNVDYIDNEFIRKNLNKGDYIVDAGCNVGNRTIVLSDIISGALMIDPNATAIKRVKENLELNNLELHKYNLLEKAVGEFEDKKKFSDYGGASTQNTIIEDEYSIDNNYFITKITTIDNELKKLKKTPAFIKIDVEGYDFKVIKGSVNTLTKGKVRLIKFENNDKTIINDINAFFRNINWQVFALDKNQGYSTSEFALINSDNLFASPDINKLKF